MLYAALAALLLATLVGLLAPLPGRRSGGRGLDRRDGDVAVYRDQLEELEHESAKGQIAPRDAATLRAEIGRRLLRADRGGAEAGKEIGVGGRGLLVASIVLAVSLASGGLYALLGSPAVPGAPFAERFDDPDALADIPVEVLVDVMADRLEGRPDDIEGWSLLGQVASRLSRFDLSSRAFENLIRLRPDDVEAYVQLGQAQVGLGGGFVGEAAAQAFARALVLDSTHPAPQYYLGLADFQAGRLRAAYDRWSALAAQTPPEAPWLDALNAGLQKSAEALGLKDVPPGPSAADIEAAGAMSGADRTAMIKSMVEGLAVRLEENRDDLAGWLRLAQAYEVLGEESKRLYVFENIIRLDPDNLRALDVLGESAAKAGENEKAAAYWRLLLAQYPENSKEYQLLNEKIGLLRPR